MAIQWMRRFSDCAVGPVPVKPEPSLSRLFSSSTRINISSSPLISVVRQSPQCRHTSLFGVTVDSSPHSRQVLDFELRMFGDRARACDRVGVSEQLGFNTR